MREDCFGQAFGAVASVGFLGDLEDEFVHIPMVIEAGDDRHRGFSFYTDINMSDARRHVHEMVDQLPPARLAAVEGLLKVMLEEDFSESDREAILAAREYFRRGGAGVAFEQVVAECGFTMDEIHHSKRE